jgi:hypothetical protein
MPESVTDRPTKAHEYLFLLGKSEKYFYDADAIREPQTEGSLERWGNGGTRKNGAKSDGRTGKDTSFTTDGLLPNGRNRRTVWTVATQPYSGAHFAVMPEALIEPCIKAGSSAQACEHCGAPWERVVERDTTGIIETRNQRGLPAGAMGHKRRMGDTSSNTTGFRATCPCEQTGAGRSVVLDPYGGSGTVAKVAERLQRNAVLIELNDKYLDLQDERTNGVQIELFV